MLKQTNVKSDLLMRSVIILFVLSYFRVPFLDENRIFSNVYLLGKFISIFLFLIIFLYERKFTIPKYILYAVTTQLILTMVSIYLKVPLMNLIKEVVTSISFFIIVDYLFKNYTNSFINSVFYVLFLLVMLNFAVIILYPKGIYNIGLSNRSYWLFGHVNNMPSFVYPSLLISAIIYNKNKGLKKQLSIILFLVSILSILLGGSATSSIGLVFIAATMVFKRIKINLRSVFIFSMIFLIIVVIMNSNINIIKIISKLFNRNITFTGRTVIWERVLYYIKNNFIFGYGIESAAITELKFGFISPHNRYLYILYRGGIISFILFVLFIFNIDLKTKKFNIDKRLEGLFRFTMVTCCSILILFEMETYTGSIIYFSFLLLANFNYINDMIMERKAVEG